MSKPVVYLIYGVDEHAITQFVGSLQARMGDSAMAEMNTTKFDGKSVSLDELTTTAYSVPFMTERRLVVVTNPSSGLDGEAERKRFRSLLEKIPRSTALVLVEFKFMAKGEKNEAGYTIKKDHWLLKWVKEAGDRAVFKKFASLKGGRLITWIQEQAEKEGGEITTQAAYRLAEIAEDDKYLISNEIKKLLAYVNYRRPVEVSDVKDVSPYLTEDGSYYELTDSIVHGKGQNAMSNFRRLLDEQSAESIFWGVVTHFRFLLLTREILDNGGSQKDVSLQLAPLARNKKPLHPYRAGKFVEQARLFHYDALESVYKKLLEYDVDIKSGNIETDTALETLIAALTSPVG